MSQELTFEVRDRLSSSQVVDLVRLYGNEWWSNDRTRSDVERMLLASDLLFAIVEQQSDSLVAFARVLTDRVYLALILDVIVAPEHRDRGLGRLLVESICLEPTLRERRERRARCASLSSFRSTAGGVSPSGSAARGSCGAARTRSSSTPRPRRRLQPTSRAGARARRRGRGVVARRLKQGNRLGVVSPSSPVTPETNEQFARGSSYLEDLGFEVIAGRHVRSQTLGYCASPREKGDDINAMFADRSIDGIICAQGGATANACLPHLSWPTIRANPKVFVGMSDITVLLNAIHEKTRLVTFHGNDLVWGLGRNPTDYDRNAFVRSLMEGRPGTIEANGERRTIRGGRCEGVALGGNLRCLLKLAGTPYLPDTAGSVLFLEAVDVTPETCDCMVHQLEQMGVFETLSGVVVGHIDGLQGKTGTTQLEDVLLTATARHSFPILKVDDFGHNCPNTVLPIGARVRVDADRQTIDQAEPFIA